jgi:hypothetical protein
MSRVARCARSRDARAAPSDVAVRARRIRAARLFAHTSDNRLESRTVDARARAGERAPRIGVLETTNRDSRLDVRRPYDPRLSSHDRSFHDASKRGSNPPASTSARDARPTARATRDRGAFARRATRASASTSASRAERKHRARARERGDATDANHRSRASIERFVASIDLPIAGADAREDAREGERERARDAGCARR